MPPDQISDQPEQLPPDQDSSASAGASPAHRIAWWRWPLIVLVAALVILFVQQRSGEPDSPAGPGILWTRDYPAALALAQQQQKPILLGFDARWCPTCKWMKQNVYPDPQVRQAAEAFIPVMLDTDEHPRLTAQYGVGPLPAYFVLKPDGSPIATSAGPHYPQEFITFLNHALQKIN